jgi:NADPH:quinone reductase-like Zn-dependent oxidoreductase
MGSQPEFEAVMRFVFDGRLSVPVDGLYLLPEARQAEERMQSGEHFGKILLEVAPT